MKLWYGSSVPRCGKRRSVLSLSQLTVINTTCFAIYNQIMQLTLLTLPTVWARLVQELSVFFFVNSIDNSPVTNPCQCYQIFNSTQLDSLYAHDRRLPEPFWWDARYVHCFHYGECVFTVGSLLRHSIRHPFQI